MTLQELFNVLSNNPSIVIFYFVALPLTAFLCGVFGRGEGHLSPWKYTYSGLLYMAAIPGVFAIILNVYLFLFQRQNIMNTDIFTQILPVLAMFLTFFLIRRNVDLHAIPGFDRLSGLILIVTAILAAMWILDRTHLIAITIIPFQYVLIVLVVLLILANFGWKRLAKK